MNKEQIEAEIIQIEADWKIYHRVPRDHKMPDMMRLTKLRIELRNIHD